jgi:hypothetical protein
MPTISSSMGGQRPILAYLSRVSAATLHEVIKCGIDPAMPWSRALRVDQRHCRRVLLSRSCRRYPRRDRRGIRSACVRGPPRHRGIVEPRAGVSRLVGVVVKWLVRQNANVRFVPKSDKGARIALSPFGANCSREHLQQKPGRGPFRLLTKLM